MHRGLFRSDVFGVECGGSKTKKLLWAYVRPSSPALLPKGEGRKEKTKDEGRIKDMSSLLITHQIWLPDSRFEISRGKVKE